MQGTQIGNPAIQQPSKTRLFSLLTLIEEIKHGVLVKYELDQRVKIKSNCIALFWNFQTDAREKKQC